jgi:AcrR family transcriptional regulator
MPKVLSTREVEAFRDRLCEVAAESFAERGYAGVTLRSLAQELGCSPMTPYRYFESKDHILAAVRSAAFGRFAGVMEAAAASADEPVGRLRALAEAYIDFAGREPAAYRLMFEMSQPRADEFPELVRASRRAREAKVVVVREAIEAGRMEGDPIEMANLLWASLHGVVALHLAGTLPRRLDFRHLAERMIEVLLRGILLRG